jgi:hypothetical protein
VIVTEVDETILIKSERTLERRLKLISSVFGGARVSSGPNTFPPVTNKMTRTDWQILKCLRKDPRRSVPSIAGEVEASVRTVRRRIVGMTESNVFFLVLVPDLRKTVGVTGNFIVSIQEPSSKKEIDISLRNLSTKTVFLNTAERGYSVLTATFDNLQEAEETRSRIEGWMESGTSPWT